MAAVAAVSGAAANISANTATLLIGSLSGVAAAATGATNASTSASSSAAAPVNATLLTQMKYGGSVAACGLVGGSGLETTVIPFLLRGVNLLGMDSVMYPQPARSEAWQRLAVDLPMEKLESTIEMIGLEQLPEYGRKILAGQTRGRVVVDMGK